MENGESPVPKSRIRDKIRQYFERRKLNSLQQLRSTVHSQCSLNTDERIATNPKKTEEELRLGVYLEEIEPQVREAVREFNRKGYPTESSGFWGEYSEYQIIEGDFLLDAQTAHNLREMGIDIVVDPSWKYKVEEKLGIVHPNLPEEAKFTTAIQFKPAIADLKNIEKRWKQIAEVLPDRGKPAIRWHADT